MKTTESSAATVRGSRCSTATTRTDATTEGVLRTAQGAKSLVPGLLRTLVASAALAAVSAHAIVYDFLPVTITGANTGQFTSQNTNGFITATTAGTLPISQNNTVNLSAFTNLFLASGVVQGWLTRYDNNAVYTNTFYLTNYNLSASTVFGMWNITEETNTYHLELYDGTTKIAPVFTWNFVGYDDNSWPPDVLVAWYHMNLDFNTGIFNPTNFTMSGPRIDCDAAFWNNIPTNTTRIVLTGRLSTNNMDGVEFYFAEPRPPCTIVCPSNITAVVCGQGGTNVTYALPTVFGDCGTNRTATCDPVSGSFFPLGTHSVHCTVPGETNLSCDFTVTVVNSDTNPPVITCPSNIVVFTCGTSAMATYTVTATDDSGIVTTNISPPSGSVFPLGTNPVFCAAIDGCSNTTTCAFYVIVNQYPPIWGAVCPSETLSINTTGCPPVMPSLTNLVTITNQCPIPGGLTITQTPPAGTVLAPGPNNPVTITVCDTNGTCHFCYVNVNATLSAGCCSMACPTNVTVTTCGTNAVVTFPTPAVSGPCGSFLSVVCSPPSGSLFPLGTNTVTCSATNGAGVPVVSCSFTVTVAATTVANTFDFLSVSITGPGAKFTSPNGNGFITVTNTGGPFLGLNNNLWRSKFTNLFSASGTVTGWLAQADNNAHYTNTFYLTNYNLSPSTVFGMWNITEETNTYSIKLLDSANSVISPPFTWSFMGYDDDALQGNIAWYHMNLNDTTGYFSPTNYKASGIDCDGAFWTNIPSNTRKIIVTGNLGAANADGVVFYFAELAPCAHLNCPGNMTVGTCGTNAVVYYTPIVTGASAGSATVICTPPSGAKFPLGTTTVNCTAFGPTGLLLASCSFTVTVVPVIPSLCSPVLVATFHGGATVQLSWPDTANGFDLQVAASLVRPISWMPVNATIQTAGGINFVILPLEGPTRFFRLVAPGNPGPGP